MVGIWEGVGMSIEERLQEIQIAINNARIDLNHIEALIKQFVQIEKPSLELLARVGKVLEERGIR